MIQRGLPRHAHSLGKEALIRNKCATSRDNDAVDVLLLRVERAHKEAYQAVFAAAYHEAAEKLREGHRNIIFPEGCFLELLSKVVYGFS